MGGSGIEPGDVGEIEAPAARAGIPLVLRVAWWVMLACDAVLAFSVIALAALCHRPTLCLWLVGPVFQAEACLSIGWWHTRGPGRSLWTSDRSVPREGRGPPTKERFANRKRSSR